MLLSQALACWPQEATSQPYHLLLKINFIIMLMIHSYYLIILVVHQILSEKNSYYITELMMPSSILCTY